MTEPPRRPNRPTLTVTQDYDGDGIRVKHVPNAAAVYEVRSTVLESRVITELNAQGVKTKGHVYGNGGKLARQYLNEVAWVHEDPGGSGEWVSNGIVFRDLELDPLGDDVGVDNPYAGGGDGLGDYPSHGDPADFDTGCTLDGGPISCEVLGKWYSHVRRSVSPGNRAVQTPPIFPTSQITFARKCGDPVFRRKCEEGWNVASGTVIVIGIYPKGKLRSAVSSSTGRSKKIETPFQIKVDERTACRDLIAGGP